MTMEVNSFVHDQNVLINTVDNNIFFSCSIIPCISQLKLAIFTYIYISQVVVALASLAKASGANMLAPKIAQNAQYKLNRAV